VVGPGGEADTVDALEDHRRRSRSRWTAVGAAALLAGSGLLAATPALAAPGGGGGPGGGPGGAPAGCERRVNASVEKLLRCVTPEGVTEHLQALQDVADAHGGNRASTTPGYTASIDYVQDTLEASGYEVSVTDFSYDEVSYPGGFAQVSPTPTTYEQGVDYLPADGTGEGDLQGVTVTAVAPGTGASGCTGTAIGVLTGTVALIERGTCSFGEKVTNAAAAGAVGVILVNNVEGPLNATLGGPATIPAVGVPTTVGAGLAGAVVDLSVAVETTTQTTQNLTAELPGRVSDGVVVVGGHLDSVPEGPGVNDNGSGSATILEVAQNLANTRLQHPVRFAFWGAEELGLLGSQAYVDSLSEEELARIGSYLNFDMLGSPNYANFVYDSDGSSFPAPEGYVSPESAAIEQTFEDFYGSRGIAFEDTEFDGRSDYQAFADAGIPSGGLFSGAEGLKTDAQAAAYGGVAGQPYDACYHQACDDIDNVSAVALDQNSDAVAYAVLTIAQAGSGPGQGGPGHGGGPGQGGPGHGGPGGGGGPGHGGPGHGGPGHGHGGGPAA